MSPSNNAQGILETPREIGQRMGVLLEDLQSGLETVRHLASREVAQRRATNAAGLERARYSADLEQRQWDYVNHRLQAEEDLAKSLGQAQATHPEKFSITRGVLFMAFAGLAIAGDVTFLGFVLGELLGTALRDPVTQLTFANLAFRAPLMALRTFPDVAMLTVSLLTAGFFLKLWHEAFLDYRDNPGRVNTLWFWMQSAVLILMLVMLALVSAVRLQMRLGQDYDSSLGRTAVALLGFVLPLVSGFYFLAGMDRVGARANLARARIAQRYWNWRMRKVGERRNLALAALAEISAQHSLTAGEDHLRQEIELAESQYISAYKSAARDAVQRRGAGGVAALLRDKTISDGLLTAPAAAK